MSETDCVFCRIARGDVPSTFAYEDERAVAFHDLNPQAPVHFLVVPREHVESVAELPDSEADLAGHLLLVAARAAREAGLREEGYRVVANVGGHGGQSVDHLHFHVLGGRQMTWPPG